MHPFQRIRRQFRSCSRCCRAGLLSLVFLLWFSLRPHQTRSYRGLDVWLDHHQAKEVMGVNVPYYFIQNDRLSAHSSSAQTRHLSTRSRLQLSRDTRFLNISFSAPAGYHYAIEDVTTSNPTLVGYPLFSIPTSGRVPSKHTVFSIEFFCRGKDSGSALISFRLRFQTDNFDGRDIEASPLAFQIEKECGEASGCRPPCAEGGVCNSDGKCDCRDGYYGLRCEQVICTPHCYNGGTCVRPGICACPDGFSGKFCHLASCKDNCYNHGRCIAPGKCKCYRNWFGDTCQYPVNGIKSKNTSDKIIPEKDDSLQDFDPDQLKEGNIDYSSE